jgi:NAD-reducing hydrogenase small subunit
MSFLDLDEWLFDLAEKVVVVYSPIADIKAYPENVDVALIEGAVANDEHLELVRTIRANTKTLISFGDCAVTGNVTAMRNPLGRAKSILQYVYVETPAQQGPLPCEPGIVPALLDRVRPVHEVVPVEFYIPGCPPDAALIREKLCLILNGC